MSKGNQTETDILAKLFKNTALPFDAITDLEISLHTADPGDGGDQTTSEATYGSYARVPVVRTAGGWTVGSGAAVNAAAILFPQCTLGTNVITHFAVGTAHTGAGQILYSGALTTPLTVSVGVLPQFAAGTMTITED